MVEVAKVGVVEVVGVVGVVGGGGGLGWFRQWNAVVSKLHRYDVTPFLVFTFVSTPS